MDEHEQVVFAKIEDTGRLCELIKLSYRNLTPVPCQIDYEYLEHCIQRGMLADGWVGIYTDYAVIVGAIRTHHWNPSARRAAVMCSGVIGGYENYKPVAKAFERWARNNGATHVTIDCMQATTDKTHAEFDRAMQELGFTSFWTEWAKPLV